MRMRWFLVAAAMLLVVSLWAYRRERVVRVSSAAPVAHVSPAATVAPAPPVVSGPFVTVGGIVVDEAGRPVEGADVSVDRGGAWMPVATTDEHGRWTLGDVPRGKVVFDIFPHEPYEHDGGPVYEPPDDVSFTIERPRGDLVLRVVHNAIIDGVVVDTAGRPLANAAVHFGTNMHGPGWLETDTHGRVHAYSDGVGRVRIEAFTDLLGAPVQWLTLTPNGHADVRFVLAPSTIAGTAVDPRGKPVADGYVNANGPVARRLYLIENGHFDLGGLSPGEYELAAGHSQGQINYDDVPVVKAHTGDRHVVLVVPDP